MIALQMVIMFATALVISLAVIPAVMRLATAYGWLDVPDGGHVGGSSRGSIPSTSKPVARRIHTVAVPRLGGIGIGAGFAAAVLVGSTADGLGWLMGPSILIFLLGLVDDLWPVPAWAKFVLQVGFVSLAVFLGGVSLSSLSLTDSVSFDLPLWVGLPLSVFIVVGAINAVNMIDGLDGLAGGVVLIGVVLLSYLAFLSTGNLALLVCVSLPLIGALMGFLKYNSHPASIFMGDGGSNWLGYMSGMMLLMVMTKYSPPAASVAQWAIQGPGYARGIPLFSTLMCLAVPIFDTASVIVARTRKGIHPMKADKRHFHHTLLRLGLSHGQAVTAVYFVALASGVAGLAPVAFPGYGLWWTPYAMALLLVILFPLGLQVAENSDRMIISELLEARTKAADLRTRKILRFWETLNRYTIYGVLLLAPIIAGTSPKGIALAGGIVAGALLIVTLFGRLKQEFLQTLLLALGALILLIAINSNALQIELQGQRYSLQMVYNTVFIWLSVSTTAFILLTIRKNYLVIHPSDFLLLIIPLALILVPEPYRTEFRLNVIGLRSLVLFAAMRTMVKRHKQATYRFSLITIVGLSFVFLVGVFGLRFVT